MKACSGELTESCYPSKLNRSQCRDFILSSKLKFYLDKGTQAKFLDIKMSRNDDVYDV